MATLLLVEDEEDLRENIEIVLQHTGHRVLTAADGKLALAQILKEPPDLVITDIGMPNMNGHELVKEIRDRHPELADMPVIFLTALGEREDEMAGRHLGADDYLVKPVDYALLKATLEARLARAEQANSLKQKQLVKLFKTLQNPAPPPTDPAAKPVIQELDKLRALAGDSFAGRLSLFFPDTYVPNYAAHSTSVRLKLATAMRQAIQLAAAPGDLIVDLGAGTILLAAKSTDPKRCAETGFQARSHIVRALTRRGGGGGPGEEMPDGDADGLLHGIIAPEIAEKLDALLTWAGLTETGDQKTGDGLVTLVKAKSYDLHPIWQPKMQRVDHCLLVDPHAVPRESDQDRLDAQCGLIDTAVAEIMASRLRNLDGHNPTMVVVPLDVRLFGVLDRHRLEQAVVDLSGLVDRVEIGFRLIGLDADIPTGAVRSTLRALTKVAGLVVGELELENPFLPVLLDAGCRCLHLDLRQVFSLGFKRERMILLVADAIKSAAKLGFEVWISGVDISLDAKQCVEAGASFISGKAIGTPKSHLVPPFKLGRSTVFLMA